MEEQKHSGLGIASFITSITSGILIFLLFVIAGVMEASSPGGIDEDSVGAVVIGLFIIASLGLCLISIGLGIGGLLQKDRKTIFAILGTVFSGLTLIGTVFLIMLGLAME